MARSDHEFAVILLGSNVEKERNMPEAVRLIRRHPDIEVRKASRLYESPSMGGPLDAPSFFNCALEVCTELGPRDLRSELRQIEDKLGRVRTDDPNAPRTIDLDVVLYGDVVEDFGDWRLPDPDLATTRHALEPVAEIVPDWVHPEAGVATNDLLVKLTTTDEEEVERVMAIQLSTPYVARAPEDFDDVGDVYAPHFESLVRAQLTEIGEDPDRQGLRRTPLRVAKAMDFLTSGYTTSLDDVINDAVFDAEGAEEMVLVKDIEYYSMCEHHMLPFFGRAAVAYLPKGTIVGLSKIARIVDLFGRRLQVQERMTNQIADAITEALDPYGVAVVLEGKHLCMMMRGVQKQDSAMITSAMRGTFKDDPRTRNEFLDLLKR